MPILLNRHVSRRLILWSITVSLTTVVPASTEAEFSSRVQDGIPTVYVAEVDAIIHPVSAEFMLQTIARADNEDVELIVFILRTPGGLVESTRTITSSMIASRTRWLFTFRQVGHGQHRQVFLLHWQPTLLLWHLGRI